VRLAVSILVFTGLSSSPSLALAQSVTVTGAVSVVREAGGSARNTDNAEAVIWLKPVSDAAGNPPHAGRSSARQRFKILQQHKRFEPHVLAVPAGSAVDFPNLDPFFHNVFSMFDGKRFDLGLYEAGASHNVVFDRPGVCFIFCNIHPEMSAVVVVTDSPYYAVSDKAGKFSIADVPPGRYLVSVWHERGKVEVASDFPRPVTISRENVSLAPIRLIDPGQLVAPHKNKYGRDYDSPQNTFPTYK
jgi:plastocyanin